MPGQCDLYTKYFVLPYPIDEVSTPFKYQSRALIHMKWHPGQYTYTIYIYIYLYFDTREPGWIVRLRYYPTKRALPPNWSWPCKMRVYCSGITSYTIILWHFINKFTTRVVIFFIPRTDVSRSSCACFSYENSTQINVYVTSCKCCRPQYCQLEVNGKLQRTFNRNTKLFFRENALQYERHRMSVTVSGS